MLVNRFGTASSSLSDLRIVTISLLGYSAFLRFSEIANIRIRDLQFSEDHFSIFIRQSKTDKYNEGSSVSVSMTNSKVCPYSMLQRYIQAASIQPSSNEFIFRQMTYCKSKNSFKLRSADKPISYTRTREIMLAAFSDIGLDSTKFGVHNLRSGGATAAAAAGFTDRLFKKHGRWRSEKAKDGYVREGLTEKLSVSKNLGL